MEAKPDLLNENIVSFTIRQALIPTPGGYETVDVQLAGDRIAAIGPGLPPLGTVINGENKLLLPGFVNAHTHSSEVWQRGLIPPSPLELWLADLYECVPLDPEQIYLGALATAVETLLSGGTSLVDHLVLIPGQELETIAAAVKAYRDIGIRAFVGPLVQDESLPAGLPKGKQDLPTEPFHLSTTEILNLMAIAVDRFHQPEARINILVAPTGTQLCSDALFTGCIDLSDRHHLCRHTHLLETKAQKLLAQEKYGCSAVAYLHQINYLGPQASLAHCVWLDDPDIQILAATGATVVHNPLSNLRLGSGIAPILKYLRAGVNVALGCDGAASNDAQDMLEVIKIGSLLHQLTSPDYHQWLTPRKAIALASLGGATGLDLAQELGSLTVGKKADLVLYDLTQLSLLPRTDPIGLLVLGRPTQVVDRVWVNGQPLVQAGEVTTIDLPGLKQNLFERSQWQMRSPSPNRQNLEQHYRQVMGLD